ncbi:hypothetical protein [Paenibacillus silvae]|uniref:hypothetical protein n=1 Tax=Paenibacillus silvae TaxID=1325358 RepID=UPI002005DA47|nr:hypothetical protein [Paenibacillus silvae]MCK6075375.1 hypothetical protein [Paenibacillus silvae]MCK6149762.1 hypothetical protein [Paenibacillus silvae]MCK6268060.1 hypothetical protein [Paenibacillus silvae]
MCEQLSFSRTVLNEWERTWDNETIDYLTTAQEKIFFSLMDLNSFYYIQNELNKKNKIWLKEVENGNPFEFPSSLLQMDYYSTEQPAGLFMSKITLNFYGTVHSFFDTYAHFLHKALFPQDTLPILLNFKQVKNKIKSDSSMKNIEIGIDENEVAIFPYVTEINNMNKHKKHVSPFSWTNLVTGEQSFFLPAFRHKNDHEEKITKDTLESSCKMVIDFFNNVTQTVYDYSLNTRTRTE